jgi:uncharacterized protein YciI
MMNPMDPMDVASILEREDEYEDEDEVPMAVLALPERMSKRGSAPLPHEVQEPRSLVNLRTTDPACQVLPPGSPFGTAYDFYALDIDPAEFAQNVPEPYRAVIRSGASSTAYDARQLVAAVKGDVHNQGLPLADRKYALDTDRGTCNLTRDQYVDLWERASGRTRISDRELVAVEVAPLGELLRSLSGPAIAGRVLSDDDARRALAWRVAGAHVYPSVMDFVEPRLEAAVGMMLNAIDAVAAANAESDPDAARKRRVARAELLVAVALRNPQELTEISHLIPAHKAGRESLYALESLLKAHSVMPQEVSSWDAEEGAIRLVDAFPLVDMDDYVEALETAARAGAQRFSKHVVEYVFPFGYQLDPDVAADLASLARENGHEQLAAYFSRYP